MSSEARRIRVLVVDDHPVFREGVAALILGQDDMSLVGEAQDGRQALEAFERHSPDVTLMDLQMPGIDGIEAIRSICASHPGARIMVLTTYAGDAQAARAIKAGAVGYLLKSSLRKQMLDAIRRVDAGLRYIPPEIAAGIAAHASYAELSPRELEVLHLVAAGDANKRIARRLAVSEDTIKAHLKNIFSKLEVSDRTQAVVVAAKRGILTI